MATATATKSARKAAPATAKRNAKQSTPVVEAPKRSRKQAEPAPEPQPLTRNQQGHVIQAAMTAATNAKRPMTVEQLATETGYSVARVTEHVDWEVSKGRSKLNGKGQVLVLSQPVYRNVG